MKNLKKFQESNKNLEKTENILYDKEKNKEREMKSNFFKYIFILFVIGIIIFAIYKVYVKEEKIENEIEEVRKQRRSRGKRPTFRNFQF